MTDEVTKLWSETLSAVSRVLPRPSYETWVRPAWAMELDGAVLVLGVPSPAARQMVEERYLSLLEEKASEVFQKPVSIRLVAPDRSAVADQTTGSKPRERATPLKIPERGEKAPTLNPRYTFDSFVVGNSNRMAHAASLAVSEMPAKAYNPLFLYGGVGLGKTHLMHAIGNHVLEQQPRQNVLYLSSENFTNEMINSIRDDRMTQFRNRFRTIDVLLIDDIQFLSGKERTQEEFFHTFEALHGAAKQVVISSDRLPREIPTLEERLRSRFEWGLITDVQPPDFETRIAILRKKAQTENLEIPDDVLTFVASKIETNIRELEGALIRLVAFLSLNRAPCTIEMAEAVLQDLIPKPKLLTVRRIQEEVARVYGMTLEDLTAKSRARAVSYPRQIAMYLCRELTAASLPKLGDEFGGRDHTTVLHAYAKITADMAADPSFRELVEDLGRKLRG